MLIKHNLLRMYRKQSNLMQADIAYILGLPNYTRISRWEQGHRHPPLKMLIGYTLLFGVPIEALYKRQKTELLTEMIDRASRQMKKLQDSQPDNKTRKRIVFLQALLNRLDMPAQ
ncbi:MAG TPA: helix-turn-helix transcriptional regulator [Chitinophagales bacterium]